MRVKIENSKYNTPMAKIEGIICFFPTGFTAEVGTEVSVMITGTNPKNTVLFVSPVTDDYVLVDHTGFECSGSMCCTTAGSPQTAGVVTPGTCPVYVADNVNCSFGYLDVTRILYPKIPGKAWVLKSDISTSKVTRKVVCRGLDSLQEVDFYVRRYSHDYARITELRKQARK